MSRDLIALEIFERYLEMPVATRDDWLARRTADDAALASQVATMIAADKAGVIDTGGAIRALDAPPPPKRIGAYRIADPIGHGGMGSVYRGVRDEGDFTHEVAIKIIKPGLLSERLDARFRAERRLLASLRHPNIAQLYDGGETAEGAPYIVMELVEGEPLLVWADQKDLSVDARAALFIDICGAVAFAHRNLIVHRDITPSNIMVTADGVPKLIDFGIARAAEVAADVERGAASIGSLSLTPGFAAPERMTSAGITTAADIFSLGKVLAALIPRRPPDLDAIVRCATAADPNSRYATVDALAGDLTAWRGGFAVSAASCGARYLISRFVRRHAVAVAVTGGGLLLLIGAFIATAIAYEDAETARVAEARRFDEVRSLATYLLFDLDDRLRRVPGNTDARADLTKRAQNYLSRLTALPQAERDLRVEVASGFIRLAEILGSPLDRNLGDVAGAKDALLQARKSVEDAQSTGGPAPDTRIVAARIDALSAMIAFHQEGDVTATRRLLAAAQALLDAVPSHDRDAGWRDAQRVVGRSLIEFLLVNEELTELPRAVTNHRRFVASWPEAARQNHGAAIELAFADYHAGAGLAYTDREAQAFDLLARSMRGFMAAEAARPNDPDLLYWMGWSGSEAFGSAARLDRAREAARLLAAARNAADRLVAIADSDRSVRPLWRTVSEIHAVHLAETGQARQAVDLQRAVIASNIEANGADPGGIYSANLGYNEMMLGQVARSAGDRPLACLSWRSARQRFARAERDKALLGFHAAFLPGLDRNLAACAAGRPLAAMREIR